MTLLVPVFEFWYSVINKGVMKDMERKERERERVREKEREESMCVCQRERKGKGVHVREREQERGWTRERERVRVRERESLPFSTHLISSAAQKTGEKGEFSSTSHHQKLKTLNHGYLKHGRLHSSVRTSS